MKKSTTMFIVMIFTMVILPIPFIIAFILLDMEIWQAVVATAGLCILELLTYNEWTNPIIKARAYEQYTDDIDCIIKNKDAYCEYQNLAKQLIEMGIPNDCIDRIKLLDYIRRKNDKKSK